jgi:hypothetical protein
LKPQWVNSILEQCRAADVPFFFKQWGGVQKKKAGRTLNGKLYDEYPVVEASSVPAYPERIRRITMVEKQFRERAQIARQRVLQGA